MKSKFNVYTIFTVVIAMSFITIVVTSYSQTDIYREHSKALTKSENKEKNDAPILDFETEVQKKDSEGIKQKDKFFNGRGATTGKQITELPTGVEPLPTINHWWVGLPVLPVEQSTAVVMGEITDTAAHLSEDKTGIYSEFSVQVSEVFKDKNNSIKSNDTILASREGGSVRFASGRINKYRIDKQGMPQKGGRYVLFLKQISDSNDYLILTGYKFSDGKITPLDSAVNKDPRADLPFAKYSGTPESAFLQDLRTTLQSTVNKGGSNQ